MRVSDKGNDTAATRRRGTGGAGAAPSPFTLIVRDYRRGHRLAPHAHAGPQLLYASAGVVAVTTPAGSWILPPQKAVWLPAGLTHETAMLTPVRITSLHVRPAARWKAVPCKAIAISPLLRELILALEAIDPAAPAGRRDGLIVDLIGEEIEAAEGGASPIPMPAEPRLKRLCEAVVADPSLSAGFDDLARAAGGSTKTLARLFDRELGMSFRRWRELVQVEGALAHLAEGRPAKVVAAELGYTASALTVMLRRRTGLTPQDWRARMGGAR